MPLKKSTGLTLTSLAAVGIMASAAPANAATQVDPRPAGATAPVSLTDSTVENNAIVRVFTVNNTTGMDLKVASFTDPRTHADLSLWKYRPSVGETFKNNGEISWSASPYQTSAGRTALDVVLVGTDPGKGHEVRFTVRLLPGITSSGISCPEISDPAYTSTGGGSVGHRNITLTRSA